MAQNAEVPQPPMRPTAEQAGEMDQKQERMWASLCHLAGFAVCIVWLLGNITGPLLLWLLKRQESQFVDENGKEAVNFQISVTIYAVVGCFLTFTLIGFLILPAAAIFDAVFTIVGAVKASNGEGFRYPVCIRFIR